MKIRVIIVEDCLIQSALLKKILENEDFEVTGTFRSGAEAVDGCRKKNPALVLMDIYLKGNMTGLEAAKKIRETHEIPFIFITASENTEAQSQKYYFDRSAILPKPVSKKELLNAISLTLNPSMLVEKTSKSIQCPFGM